MSYGINNSLNNRLIPDLVGSLEGRGNRCRGKRGRGGARGARRSPRSPKFLRQRQGQALLQKNYMQKAVFGLMSNMMQTMSQMTQMLGKFLPQQFNPFQGPQCGSPFGNQFGNPFGNPLGSPLGNQFGSPVGDQFGSPFGSPIGQPNCFPGGPGSLDGSLPVKALETSTNEQGNIEVVTKDGFKIATEGKGQAWTITSPEGKTTRIWGDPHVNESDGDKWDFQKQATFEFGENKITVEVAPYGNGNTVTSAINIYSGNERVTIDGIDKDQPKITSAMSDAFYHDLQLSDGDVFYLSREWDTGEDAWRRATDNKELIG